MVFSFHKDRAKVGTPHNGFSIAFIIMVIILGAILLLARFLATPAKATNYVAVTGYAWSMNGTTLASNTWAGYDLMAIQIPLCSTPQLET